jgi:hypothetical protein
MCAGAVISGSVVEGARGAPVRRSIGARTRPVGPELDQKAPLGEELEPLDRVPVLDIELGHPRPVVLLRHQSAAPVRLLAGPELDVLPGQLPQGGERELPAREAVPLGSFTN